MSERWVNGIAATVVIVVVVIVGVVMLYAPKIVASVFASLYF